MRFSRRRACSLPTISYATVYNSLRFLKEAGLVHEIKFGDSASRYDRETDRHDHAICNDCGKLVDFDLPQAAELMQAAARKSKFQAGVGSSDAQRSVSGLPQGIVIGIERLKRRTNHKLKNWRIHDSSNSNSNREGDGGPAGAGFRYGLNQEH